MKKIIVFIFLMLTLMLTAQAASQSNTLLEEVWITKSTNQVIGGYSYNCLMFSHIIEAINIKNYTEEPTAVCGGVYSIINDLIVAHFITMNIDVWKIWKIIKISSDSLELLSDEGLINFTKMDLDYKGEIK
jgi:hypothetical protein